MAAKKNAKIGLNGGDYLLKMTTTLLCGDKIKFKIW